MTRLLEQAVEEAQKLSPEEQDAIASVLLEEMRDEQRWDDAFARSQPRLADLATKVREDITAGKTRDLAIDALL